MTITEAIKIARTPRATMAQKSEALKVLADAVESQSHRPYPVSQARPPQ